MYGVLQKLNLLGLEAPSKAQSPADISLPTKSDMSAVWIPEKFFFLFISLWILTLAMCSDDQLCPILCDRMDCSPPGSSVHGILPARLLEWGF